MHGIGRQALDDFANLRRNQTNWGSLTLAPPWLAAGEGGPITSVRFEMGRESIQECEARIFLEQALLDEAAAALQGRGDAWFGSYDAATERAHLVAGSARGYLDGPFSRARFGGWDYTVRATSAASMSGAGRHPHPDRCATAAAPMTPAGF
jgi:hypothetical protein